MDSLSKDIRYAIRGLVNRPAFTVVAVITLALGIGANTAIFSVVNGVLLQPLPYPEPQQLVALRDSNFSKQPDSQVAPGNFIDWKRQTTVFAALEAYRTVSYNLTGDGVPERLLAGRVTSGMFRMLEAQPVLGRDFLAEEDETGREKVVLISEGLWRRRFGSTPTASARHLNSAVKTSPSSELCRRHFDFRIREKEICGRQSLSQPQRSHFITLTTLM
jgi:hypothetical protein